jgi:hypothetical protein
VLTSVVEGSASPAATIRTLGTGIEALDPGTYRIDFDLRSEGAIPPLELTLPEDWGNFNGWGLFRQRAGEEDSPVGILFWDVAQVYGDSCRWSGTDVRPGRGVRDLVEAIGAVPSRNATRPVEVTLDGAEGTYLEWSVPTDLAQEAGRFVDCDEGEFRSWTGIAGGQTRYHGAPGQVDRLWILDVDGARLVIDAVSEPTATEAEIAEMIDVVESIRFER